MTASTLALTPLLVCIAAFAIWTLAGLAAREQWLLFTISLPFFLITGSWMIWKKRPHLTITDATRLLLGGSVIVVALFLPLWTLLLVAFAMIMLEVRSILYEKTGPELYGQPELDKRSEDPYPEWPATDPAKDLAFREFRIQRAGLLEQRVPVEEEGPVATENS